MKRNVGDRVKDPVCGMLVDPRQHAVVYQQMHFAFCSVQCKERFLSSPHLYIGYPGQKAPKQESRQSIKRRRLKLSEPVTDKMGESLLENIQAMMGIKSVVIEGERIEIVYDLLEVTEEQVELQIARAGASLGQGWADRLRRAFVHCLEETEVDSMEIQPPAKGHHH